MIFFPLERSRHVVPRWRQFDRTLATGELDNGIVINAPQREPVEVRERLAEWRRSPSVVTAAEVVEAALVAGGEREAVPAAHALLLPESSPTILVRRRAETLLRRAGVLDTVDRPAEEQVERRIARLRQRARAYPRNPIAWVDLSLAYLSHGQNEPAKRAINAAVKLHTENRFVLRSASRLFLHVGDKEQALAVLRRSERTSHDPWLMAAEIATASLTERTSRLVNRGRDFLKSMRFRPFHLSELAAAVAMVRLADGDRRGARKLFVQSLFDPTGNALAQAEWVKPLIGTLGTEPILDRNSGFFEARAILFQRSGHWDRAIQEARRWVDDEPFSSRAYEASTFAASILGNSQSCEELARTGLKYSPMNVTLINNLAFALACQNREVEADELLDSINSALIDEKNRPALLATRGLIELRRDPDRAHILYTEAAALADRQGQHRVAVLARAFYAREAARTSSPHRNAALAAAEHAATGDSLPGTDLLLGQAHLLLDHSSPADRVVMGKQRRGA